MTTDPLCGDPTCENPSCTQEAIDRWNRRMEQEAHDIVWGLLKSAAADAMALLAGASWSPKAVTAATIAPTIAAEAEAQAARLDGEGTT